MFPPLTLQVITVEGILLDVVGVHWVKAELAGDIGVSVWPGHAPLLAETVPAPLRYGDSRGEHTLPLREGILHVEDGKVTIYTSPSVVLEAGGEPGGDGGQSG